MSDNGLVLRTTFDLDKSDKLHLQPEFAWLNEEVRRYLVTKNLLGQAIGEGAYGQVYMCVPLDHNGEMVADAPALVAKLAKVPQMHNGRTVTREKRKERINRVHDNNIHEYWHVRKRLTESSYANRILDYGRHAPGADREHEIPFTVQRYLSYALDLDAWLLSKELRENPALGRDAGRYINQNWWGIRSRKTWLEVLIETATAIKDLHLRRVYHGDIHPGNIFVRKTGKCTVELIDFGESQLFTPGMNDLAPRNPNPYAAPELMGPRASLNEKVDVFAFGQLALYLANGMEKLFDRSSVGEHRGEIYNLLKKSNPTLLTEEPRILDLIGRATASDPADRPRMIDILEDLEAMYVTLTKSPYDPGMAEPAPHILRRLADALDDKSSKHHPILRSMLERQIRELEHSFDGLATEMVQFTGTRDHSIRMLVSLFDGMTSNDTWTSATTLDMWQNHALGVDGTYFSATIRAVMRRASVRRAFMFSVEELGLPFCQNVLSHLANVTAEGGKILHARLAVAIADFKPSLARQDLGNVDRKWRCNRLCKIVDALAGNIARWSLVPPIINSSPVIDTRSAQGFVLAMCPVGMMGQVVDDRDKSPVSLLYKGDSDKWILVGTDAQGRRTSIHENNETGPIGVLYPHLLGVRVFQSVQEVRKIHEPQDRIDALNNLFKDKCVNICPVADEFSVILREATLHCWGSK